VTDICTRRDRHLHTGRQTSAHGEIAIDWNESAPSDRWRLQKGYLRSVSSKKRKELAYIKPCVNALELINVIKETFHGSVRTIFQSQQDNSIDCGPIASYTIIRLLQGIQPLVRIDDTASWGQQLCHDFLKQIYRAVIGSPRYHTKYQQGRGR
jgi:hypothetical protein